MFFRKLLEQKGKQNIGSKNRVNDPQFPRSHSPNANPHLGIQQAHVYCWVYNEALYC